jgi:serine/threonine protein kinase
MSADRPSYLNTSPSSPGDLVDEICAHFEAAWGAGQRPRIEECLGDAAEPKRPELLRQLLTRELAYRIRCGEQPTPDDYRGRFPESVALISRVFSEAGPVVSHALPSAAKRATGPGEMRSAPAGAQVQSTAFRPGLKPSLAGEPGTGPGPGGAGFLRICDLAPGQEILHGRYRVERFLGKGGMGEVWQVRHLHMGRLQALKLISPRLAIEPRALQRFSREAKVMAALNHPNIVVVHDAGTTADSAYILMEFVPGQSLDKLLQPGVPQPLEWVAPILEQFCDALQEAHQKGIVHRDLKPSNLMLVDGRPAGKNLKVLDFGLAKILVADPEETTACDESGRPEVVWVPDVSLADQFLGTALYASPEQAAGKPLDRRSDLYAVGVMLFEFLTGDRPFTGDARALRYHHCHTQPPPFGEWRPDVRLPPEVEQVVLRCLAKDPADRYQTAQELSTAFVRAVSVKPLSSVPSAPPPRIEQITRFARLGLGALSDMMKVPAVRGAAAGFKNTFQIAREQIGVLGKYKGLHDLLHTLHFHYYNPMVHEAKRFPEDDARSNLEDHELTLQGIIEGLRELADQEPFVADERPWIRDLARADDGLRKALVDSDPRGLMLANRLVGKVLSIQPSRINTRLNNAAKNLQLPNLVRALATIRDELKGPDLDSERLLQLEEGVNALDGLNRSLSVQISDHDRWQAVDNELRWVEALLDLDTVELEMAWPDLRSIAEPFFTGSGDDWSTKLRAAADRLDQAIAARDPVKIRARFRHLRRQAGDRFYRVDLALKNLCEELRTIGEPLALVLETIS